ncbi:MAG: UDP-N-acetylmuramoyl-tripeptide--D-alanyl-D-alanine ligase [Chloroflexota bacterium]
MTDVHPLDLSSVLAGTGAVLRGNLPVDTRFRSIERDAREVQPGDCFIAIRGERFDGHEFPVDAAARGASAALVTAAWADAHPDAPIPLLSVPDDPVAALQRLASWWRDRLPVRVVGITGSVGKTSAKEVTASVLSRRFRTYRSAGNLNSEIGLPLCLLDVTPDTEVAVLEMGGAYAFGELALLASIARPEVSVVLNIHPVHLERMGSIEAIAETKAELIDAVPTPGAGVLNGDDPRTRAMAARCASRVITYGLGADCEVRGGEVEDLGMDGCRFTLTIGGRSWPVATPMVGAHVPMLALQALAVGHAFGMAPGEMIPALAERAAQVRVRFVPGPRGAVLIDDTYNASTPSMLSSLGVLAAHPAPRKVAVLGDMRELGPISAQEHQIVGRRAAEVADLLVTFGNEARIYASEAAAIDAATPLVASFGADDRDGLVQYLLREIGEGDVVLLKGSRGLRMESIVQALSGPDAR